MSYHPRLAGMKGITVKLSDASLKKLKQVARATGRSVAALVRERVESAPIDDASVHALSADLAGSVAGGRRAATNVRRKFRRA